MKMYIAAMRIADFFGCDAIGIQYQQGLKDMVPASNPAEGLFNNPERPPVYHAVTGQELFAGMDGAGSGPINRPARHPLGAALQG